MYIYIYVYMCMYIYIYIYTYICIYMRSTSWMWFLRTKGCGLPSLCVPGKPFEEAPGARLLHPSHRRPRR